MHVILLLLELKTFSCVTLIFGPIWTLIIFHTIVPIAFLEIKENDIDAHPCSAFVFMCGNTPFLSGRGSSNISVILEYVTPPRRLIGASLVGATTILPAKHN